MGKLIRGALLGGLASALGCTALLGDFEVSPGAGTLGGSDDAGGQDGTADGSAADAQGDAFDAQATVFSACGAGAVRTIETTEAATAFKAPLYAMRVGNAVRVIALQESVSGATIFTFDPKQGNPNTPVLPSRIDLTKEGEFLDARRVPGQAIIATLFLERDAVPPTGRLKIHELPDNDLTLAKPFKASQDFNVPPPGANITGALGTYQQNNEYFWALGVPSPVPPQSDLFIGHRVNAVSLPAPVKIFTGDGRDVRARHMARSVTTQYIFNDKGPDKVGDPGSSYFRVPHDTASGTIPPVSLTPPGSNTPFVVLAASSVPTSPRIRAAFAEINFAGGGGTPGQLRIGEIMEADLPSLDGTKVPPAFTLGSLLEAPIGNMEARFFGDDFLWIGTPPAPQEGQGLNFLWYDSKNRVLRGRQVGQGRLLADHKAIGGASLWLSGSTGFTAELDLVFIEESGGKFFLQYVPVSCVR